MLVFGAYGARSKRAFGARENFSSLGWFDIDFKVILEQFPQLPNKNFRACGAENWNLHTYICRFA